MTGTNHAAADGVGGADPEPRAWDGEIDPPEPGPGSRGRRGRKRRALLIAGVASLVLATALWTNRNPIADAYLRDVLQERGVEAAYTIDRIGLRQEVLSNIRVGPAENPTLTARRVTVDVDHYVTGPVVRRVRAEGVRVRATLRDGALDWGALTPLLPKATGEPFRMPDLNIDLVDARFDLVTPWGAVVLSGSAKGHAQRDLTGPMRLTAPMLNDLAGCKVRDARWSGTLRIRAEQPALAGPVRIAAFDCGTQGRGEALAFDGEVRGDATLRAWRGAGRLRAGRLVQGDGRALTLRDASVATRFDRQRDGTTTMHFAQLDGRATAPELGTGHIGGDGLLTADAKGVAGNARVNLSDAAVASTRLAAIDQLARTRGDGVAGLGAALADAAGRAARRFGARATVTLDAREGPLQLAVRNIHLASASGVTVSPTDPQSRIALDRDGWSARGTWAIHGGGMPRARVQADIAPNGALSGVLEVDPLATNGVQIALSPVHATRGPSGDWTLSTTAVLSGALANGVAAQSLTTPVLLQTRRGALTLNPGTHRAVWQGLQVGPLRLSAGQATVMGLGTNGWFQGAPSLHNAAVFLAPGTLTGAMGGTPARLTHRGVRWAGKRGWAVTAPDLAFGTGDRISRVQAGRLSSTHAGPNQMAVEGLWLQLAALPLTVSDGQGVATINGGTVRFGGSAIVGDRASPARFEPLLARNAEMTFQNGVLTGHSHLTAQRGVDVATLSLRHQLDSGIGNARLDVNNLTFSPVFQPDNLSTLPFGIIAETSGAVSGQADFAWSPAGVRSTGRFTTDRLDTSTGFGPVRSIRGEIVFDDLLAVRTAPGQVVRLGELNPGIAILDGTVRYHLASADTMVVEGGRWPFAGGELILAPTTIDFSRGMTRHLKFQVRGVDAAVFLQNFGFSNIDASGIFDGELPLVFDESGGYIRGGQLVARAGGGRIRYIGELSNRELGVIANFAFRSLRSLDYKGMTIELDGALAGEMTTALRFEGISQGEGADRNILTRQIAALPLKFNVRVQGPFRQLIQSIRGYYDPSLLVQTRLPELIAEQQREAARQQGLFPSTPDAPVAPAPPPKPLDIQAPESDPKL